MAAVRRAGIIAGVVAPIIAWTLSIGVGLTWAGYDPVRQSISLLVVAPLGWLQVLSFWVSGGLGIAWAFGLAAVLGATARDRRVVRGLLFLQAAISIGFAILPTDPDGVPTTFVGALHLVDFYAYAVTMPLTLVTMGLVMRRDPRWRAAATPTLLAALVVLIGIPLVPITREGPLMPWLGLLERLFVAVPSVWQVGAGLVAWRLAPPSIPETRPV